jgi:hypothetical protein
MYLVQTPLLPKNGRTFSLQHVLPMIVAWVILAPLSVLCVRKRKTYASWFKMHVFLVLLILVLSVQSCISGIQAVDKKPDVDHFSSLHHIVGTIACGGIVAQVLLGVYIHLTFDRSRSKVPLRDKIHWYVGRGTIVATLAAVVSGYLYVNMQAWVYIATSSLGIFYAMAYR